MKNFNKNHFIQMRSVSFQHFFQLELFFVHQLLGVADARGTKNILLLFHGTNSRANVRHAFLLQINCCLRLYIIHFRQIVNFIGENVA